MINQTRQPRLLIVALIGALVSLLAYQSFGGNTKTIVIDPAIVGTVNLEKVYGAIPQKALAEQSLQGFGQSLDETINGFLEEIEVLEAGALWRRRFEIRVLAELLEQRRVDAARRGPLAAGIVRRSPMALAPGIHQRVARPGIETGQRRAVCALS